MNCPIPEELQHLRNLINGAKNDPNDCEALLRGIIKSAADKAPAADIVRIAETIFECGMDIQRSEWSQRN